MASNMGNGNTGGGGRWGGRDKYVLIKNIPKFFLSSLLKHTELTAEITSCSMIWMDDYEYSHTPESAEKTHGKPART